MVKELKVVKIEMNKLEVVKIERKIYSTESGVKSYEKVIYNDYSICIRESLRYFDGTKLLLISVFPSTKNEPPYFVLDFCGLNKPALVFERYYQLNTYVKNYLKNKNE